MRLFFIFFFIICLNATSATISRQHADTIQSGKKINASDINDELNTIQNAINGALDTDNLLDGGVASADIADFAIVTSKIATASSGYIKNKKVGCTLSPNGTISTTIDVRAPCELYIDGVRGTLSATSSVSLVSDLDTGAAAADTFYFVYGLITDGIISLEASVTEPLVNTTRKNGTSTKKYIGSVKTRGGDTNILKFKQIGNHIIFSEPSQTTNISVVMGTGSRQSKQLSPLPGFVDGVVMFLLATDTSSCSVEYTVFNSIVREDTTNGGAIPFIAPVLGGVFSAELSGCGGGGTFTVVEYYEAIELHQ